MLMFINLVREVCQFSQGFEINVKFCVFGAITYFKLIFFFVLLL